MLQKIPVNNFEWIKDTSKFDEGFIKSIMKKVKKGILWSSCWISWKITWASQWFTFLPEKMKIEKVAKFIANLHDKTMNYF